MTDRVATLTVILDREYRTDDVEYIQNAIHMVKGVSEVHLGEVCDANHYMNKSLLGDKFRRAFHDSIERVKNGEYDN